MTEEEQFAQCDAREGNTMLVFSDKAIAMRYLDHRVRQYGDDGYRVLVEDTRTKSGLCVLWRDRVVDLKDLDKKFANCRWLLEEVLAGRQPRPVPGEVNVQWEKPNHPSVPDPPPPAPTPSYTFAIPEDLSIASLNPRFELPYPDHPSIPAELVVDVETVARILATSGIETAGMENRQRLLMIRALLRTWYARSQSGNEPSHELIDRLMQLSATKDRGVGGLTNAVAKSLHRYRSTSTDYTAPLTADLTAHDALVEFFGRIGAVNESGMRLASVAQMRLGLKGAQVRTIMAIGEQMGISRERVRQLEMKAYRVARRLWLDVGSPGLDEVKNLAEAEGPITEASRRRMDELCKGAPVANLVRFVTGDNNNDPRVKRWTNVKSDEA